MSDPTPTPAPAPAPEPVPEPAPAPAPEYKAPESQAALDRIIEARLARERAQYADYPELKKKAEEHDAYVESQKTEQQKAIDAAKGEATTETTQKFLNRIVSAEVKAVAGAAGFNDPADALQILDPSKLPVKDDEPDTDAIKALVEQLGKDKPYLLKAETARTPVPRRPKPADGEKPEKQNHEGKGAAVSALRQFGAARKSG